jgi:hypothetical protein
MNLRVLTSAIEDLSNGRKFYDLQGDGLGDFFLTASFPKSIPSWYSQEYIRFTWDISG